MPRGVPEFRQWPVIAPSKRENAERRAADNGSGSLMTLVGKLVPSASVPAQKELFSEVQRQFSLPRLPPPALEASLDGLLSNLHPDIAGLSAEALTSITSTVRADMAWRWLRYERLFLPRLPRYQLDPEFTTWLCTVERTLLQRWTQAYLPAWLGPLSAAEGALRVARLRPLPLEVALAWHEVQKGRTLDGYVPAPARAMLDYLVTACLQRMDAYYLRDRLEYRRIRGAQAEAENIVDVREALHSLANGQLTVADHVFDAAVQASEGAVVAARAAMKVGGGRDNDRGQGLRADEGTVGVVGERCATCRSGRQPLTRSPQNARFPPFVVGCTCHFAFDWEGEPLKEAGYEAELAAWAEKQARGEGRPFPGRSLLFGLAERGRDQRRLASLDQPHPDPL